MNNWIVWVGELIDKSHSSEWISGICGAGGAIIGGLLAIGLTESLNTRRRSLDQRERFAAASFSAYQRLNQIYSVTLIIRDHLQESEAVSVARGILQCLATRPIQRMSPPVFFPTDELWALTKTGGANTINAINSLDNVFNTLVDGMDTYAASRKELIAMMPAPTCMTGDEGTSMLTEEESSRLNPIVADLNGRLAALTGMAQRLAADTFQALILIATAETHPLGKSFEIQLPDPSGKLVKVGALFKIPIPVEDK